MVMNFDPLGGGPGMGGNALRFFDPLTTPEDEERLRRARLGLPIAPASTATAPARAADIVLGPTPAPAGAPTAMARDFTQATAPVFDAQGRAVPIPTPEQSLALSPFNDQTEPAGRAAAADAFVQALLAYQQSPPNPAMLVQNPEVATGAVAPTGQADFSQASPFGTPQPDGTVIGPDGAVLSGGGTIVSRGGAGAGQVTAESFLRGGSPAQAPAQPAQPTEERRPIGPGFAGNDALIDAALAGTATPVGQTDASPEGIVWPILGRVENVLGQEYTLVQTGAGEYLLWDPRAGAYLPVTPDQLRAEFTTAGRRPRTAAL